MSEKKEFPVDGIEHTEYMTGSNDPGTIRQLQQYLLNRAEERRLIEQGNYVTLLRAEHDLIVTPTSTEGMKVEIVTRLKAVRPDESYISEPSGQAVKIRQLRVFPADEPLGQTKTTSGVFPLEQGQ